MAISFISGFTSCNLSPQNSYKSQAIELFGKDLARSLRNKENSWKTLMKCSNTFIKACTVIESSKECFSTRPGKLHWNLQSNEGLIFQTNRYTRHDSLDIEGILITPFGYFDTSFKTTQAMYQFIRNLQEEFYTKLLEDSYRNKKYSFTLSSNHEASLKLLYNFFPFKRTYEIRDDTFIESDVNKICHIIKYYLDKEFPTRSKQPFQPTQYLSRGTQTENTTDTFN